MRVHLFFLCFFFPRGDRIDSVVLENWRTPRPPPALIFHQSHRIKILRWPFYPPESKNLQTMSLGTTYSPVVPQWEGPKVTNFDLCLHLVMVTGKCTDVFRGIFWFRRGVTWEVISMEELIMGEDNFNGKGAGFSSII